MATNDKDRLIEELQRGGTSFGVFGPNPFGPSPSFSGGGSGAPISPTGGSSGAPTGGSSMFDVNFNFGLGESFDDALTSILEFLNIRLSDRFIKREDGEQGKLFQQILNALKGVDSGATSIEDFLSSVSGLIPNDTVLQNVTDAAARVQYQGFLRRFGEAGEDVDKLQGVISQYENAGIQNNSIIMSMTAPGAIMTTPEDVFKKMMEESGADATLIVDVFGVLKEGGTFRGFIENVDILIQGVFNLPIPDWIPFPAIFKLPSIADIWDKTFGKVLEGVDEGCFKGEEPVADCAEQVVNGVGEAASDVTETVKGKITEVYEGVVGAVKNPEDAVQQVYDWITGIFGEDPQNMPPWIWGVVLGGVLGKEILGGLEDIFGDDVNDDGTIGVPPVTGDDFDCSSVGRIQQEGAKTEAECGGCAEGYEPKNGQCVAELDPCPGQQIRNEVSGECEDPDPGFVSGDPCKTETGESGTYDEDGNCVATVSPPPTQVDCTQPRPGYTPSFNPADNAAHFAWEEACGATHCPDGSEKPASGICGEQPQPTCNNGAVNAPDCNDCGDKTSPDMHEDGDCSKPRKQQPPQPCPNGATVESDCTECSDGSAPSAHENGNCSQPLISTTTTPPGALGFSPDCNKERPTGRVTFDLIEQQRAWDRKCGGGTTGSFNCNSLNRQTREDGSCGDCLPGYVLDENMDNCIKQEVPVTPTETPTTTETGGGASVGGGAGGDFSGVVRGISYTPQPIPEILPPSQFGQFGMLTQAPVQQPSRNTDILGGSIVAGLLGKYMVQDILDDIFKLSK